MTAMPSVKYMRTLRALPLVKAKCRRCAGPFNYYRRGRHRYFCGDPCRDLERKDNNDFYNDRARQDRLAARENAVQAHLAADRLIGEQRINA